MSESKKWTVYAIRYEHPRGYFHKLLLPLRHGLSEEQTNAFIRAHRKYFSPTGASLVVSPEDDAV